MRIAAALMMGVLGLVACDEDPDDVAKEPAAVDVSTAPTVVALAKASAGGADLDQDGIPDALEEQLIHRYRPFYKFSKEGDKVETNGPADAVQEIAHAQLKTMQGDDDVSGVIAGCGEPGDSHLVPASSLLTCKGDTSFSSAPAVSNYCLNIDDSRYGGVPIAQAKVDGTGLYGHVVPDTINGHPAYLIDYWQFYGFNNQDITILGMGSFGDHEGDWTGVQVWVDQTTGAIAKLLYMIHGHEVTFTMPAGASSTCTSCFQTVKGSQWNLAVGSFFDATELPKYSDNQAELWTDGQGVDHVVLYIERGGHETWPGAWGSATFNVGPLSFHLNAHNGLGENYLAPDVQGRTLNLGEVDHPLGDDAKIILEYNGHWGCTNAKDLLGLAPQRRSPVGPSAHCEWKYPGGAKRPPGCDH